MRYQGPLRGTYQDACWEVGGGLEDEGARPFREEGEDPVDQVRWCVLRHESGPEGRGVSFRITIMQKEATEL